MKHKLVLTSHLILATLGCICQTPAQNELVPGTPIRLLTLDAVEAGTSLQGTWKYHPGDNPEWASPTFNDATWESTDTLLLQDSLPESGWEGIGWFRVHLSVPDEQLRNMPLALQLLFLYTLFYPKLPKLSWLFINGWILTVCVTLFDLGFTEWGPRASGTV